MTNITLFGQIIYELDRPLFNKIVSAFQSDKYSKGINSWTHLVSMLFCNFSRATSLREITNGLLSIENNLVHLGIANKCPKRSSLSYINKNRTSELFKEYYLKLFEKFSIGETFKMKHSRIRKKLYLLDSSIVTLSLSLFDWARYSHTKGAIKIHTLLDYEGCLPNFVLITDGKVGDATAAKLIDIPSNSVVVADRAYASFELLSQWDKKAIKFVVRIKESTQFVRFKERELPKEKWEEILIDEIVLLENANTRSKYSKKLRRVVVYDKKKDIIIELITNNFNWTAETISELYKCRWQIESFFKEIKNHVRIKTFVGTSSNAVEIQIWTALITMLILRYLKSISKYGWCLSNLIAFLRMNLFVKIDLYHWLHYPFKPPGKEIDTIQYRIFE
ncbi:IS4 family transposase [Flavobacterium filum]|uniref:IS4 family transposase n=1 Tax=Flavobacterium filum TaxID=370974 RepID=UPI0023F56992|nr:IS4 family transposase [Flavobacterium filum]